MKKGSDFVVSMYMYEKLFANQRVLTPACGSRFISSVKRIWNVRLGK